MADSAPNLSDLVSICHTAFGKRPLTETLELVAGATLELAGAERVAILLVSLDQVAMVEVDRWLGASWDWDLGREDVDRFISELDGQRAATRLGRSVSSPDAALYSTKFGSDRTGSVAFGFGTPEEEHGALVVTGDAIEEDICAQMEVIAAQIHLATRTVRLAEAHQDQMAALARMGIPHVSLMMDFGLMPEEAVLSSLTAFATEIIPRIAA